MLMNSIFLKGRIIAAWVGIFVALGAWAHVHSVFAYTSSEANTIAVYDSVAASVVNITTEVCEPEFFFCTVPSESGSASGIVLREDGTIVTNHHVVSEARTIQVTVADGRRLKASLVASSAADDVAIIRVDVGDRPLKAIRIGDSANLRIGEKVLAIGNPFGLGQSLSVGTVSMLNRNIKRNGLVLQNLIQTDAAINPGSSGGAMVNSRAELVGMNTMILSPTGSSIRIGFAIPVNRIRKVAPGLMHAWERWTGWTLATLIVFWAGRRIYLLK
jgi:S1-C subfamily serine protease